MRLTITPMENNAVLVLLVLTIKQKFSQAVTVKNIKGEVSCKFAVISKPKNVCLSAETTK